MKKSDLPEQPPEEGKSRKKGEHSHIAPKLICLLGTKFKILKFRNPLARYLIFEAYH